MRLPLYWVDAFAARPFTGNPAAVVPLETWLPDERMQRMAFEHNLAETAFIVRTGPARHHIRWFTPTCEVDLCGHATLAAAFVAFGHLGETARDMTFDSRGGPLRVTRGEDGWLEMDFPVTRPLPEDDGKLAGRVEAALGASIVALWRTPFDLLAELAGSAAIRGLAPDMSRVAALGGRGLIVTARGDEGGPDFVSRFFAPQVGVAEDPVTGSAHCALTPFWAERFGRPRLVGHQVSARGGEVFCTLAGERVLLAGSAVLYLEGSVHV